MWDELLKRALRILDVPGIPESDWSFGGGTALALYFQHRESKDVDIFLTDAQYLMLLTPRLNRIVSRMTSDYAEGSSFLKLRFPEGEVDFIIAPRWCSPPGATELLYKAAVDRRRPFEDVW